MTATKPAMKMPELLVFVKSLATGFVSAEIWRVAFYLGAIFAPTLSDLGPLAKIGGILVGALLCLIYAVKRGAHIAATRMGRSLRIDLLIVFCTGIWTNELASPWLATAHAAIQNADPHWGLAVLLLLCTLLVLLCYKNVAISGFRIATRDVT